MELKIAKKDDRELWNELVEKSPHGTIFHTWKFLKIIEKHTNSKLYPIIGMKGTTPIGVYPLFLQKKFFLRLVFSPPPHALLLYLGPAIVDYDKLKQSKKESTFVEFQRKVNEFLESEINYNYVRVRTSPGLIDSRPFLWTDYKVEPLYTYYINLSLGLDNIWNKFNRELRKNIKISKKKGVIIKEGNKQDIEFYHKVMKKRFEEQNIRYGDYRSYLYELYDALYPNNFKIFVANYNGETIGIQLILLFKDRVLLWTGSPKSDILRGVHNELLQWEIIQLASNGGYQKVEIMDAGDDPRLRHFKSKFNPELSLWYSAEKYSSSIYKGMEKVFRFYQKFIGM